MIKCSFFIEQWINARFYHIISKWPDVLNPEYSLQKQTPPSFYLRENKTARLINIQTSKFERLQNLHLLPSRLYCRLWNCTKSCQSISLSSRRNFLNSLMLMIGSRAQRLTLITAGRELHPAPKIDQYLITPLL